ncbi:MAG: hypothetical protein KKD66_02345 [Proteobacteria bacterium]|nr:hypothetical protein [Pseudomonadota bacterium]
MAILFRGVSKIDDENNEGLLKPKGSNIEVAIKYNAGFTYDSGVTYGESEDNTVIAHQKESGMYEGCFVSFTRDKSIAIHFATSGNFEEGFIYEVDEELLKQNGVVAREVEIPEHPYESEISLRTSDGGTLPNEIVVSKRLVKPT